jgi:hypothetical protein
MDELEISKVARPVGWIKFAAASQGADSAKLLAVAPDEAPPASWLSGSFGLFGVILKSVTVDGWVVIGILGIMSVVSWYVMITKFFYVNHVQKGNKLFLKEWRHVAQTSPFSITPIRIGSRAWEGAPAENPAVDRQLAPLSHLPYRFRGNRPSHGEWQRPLVPLHSGHPRQS